MRCDKQSVLYPNGGDGVLVMCAYYGVGEQVHSADWTHKFVLSWDEPSSLIGDDRGKLDPCPCAVASSFRVGYSEGYQWGVS